MLVVERVTSYPRYVLLANLDCSQLNDRHRLDSANVPHTRTPLPALDNTGLHDLWNQVIGSHRRVDRTSLLRNLANNLLLELLGMFSYRHELTPFHRVNQFSLVQKTSLIPVLPRARGADGLGVTQAMARSPLPPRTRGRLGPHRRDRRDPPSTPAHAGPTVRPVSGLGGGRLYPRARGADSRSAASDRHPRPLPPRTRGRLGAARVLLGLDASTPAHAGPTLEYR